MGIVKPGCLVFRTDSTRCTEWGYNASGTGVGASEAAAALVTGKCWFRLPRSTLIKFSGKKPAWITSKDVVLALIKELTSDGCLYQAIEFAPDNLDQFSIDARVTLCNLAVELARKSAIMPGDSILDQHLATQGTNLKK